MSLSPQQKLYSRHVVEYTAQWIKTLNAELNPIRHLLALVGARHIVHVSRIRVKLFRFFLSLCEIDSLVCQHGEKRAVFTIFCGYLHSDINFHYDTLKRAHKGKLKIFEVRGSHITLMTFASSGKRYRIHWYIAINISEVLVMSACKIVQWNSTAHKKFFVLGPDRWGILIRWEGLREGYIMRFYPVPL